MVIPSLQSVVDNHKKGLKPGVPQLNYCDTAVMVSSYSKMGFYKGLCRRLMAGVGIYEGEGRRGGGEYMEDSKD